MNLVADDFVFGIARQGDVWFRHIDAFKPLLRTYKSVAVFPTIDWPLPEHTST